ncbi:MAG: HAMP domain-containing histidine kinase [Planctomycetes bacterium]|nr:HAMP domain-containing histidine kinase [Planctomycetota bacterium]
MAEDWSLIDGLAHDLRTPLTPMMLLTHMLEEHPRLPTELLPIVRMLRENVDAESRLLDAILDWCRARDSRLELSLTAIDLHEVVQEALDQVRSIVEHPRVTTELGAQRRVVAADRTRLVRTLAALVVDAHARSAAPGVIVLSTRDDPTGVRLRIHDASRTDPNLLTQALQATWPDDARRALDIGLRLTRVIVELHRGTLIVTADPSGGTLIDLTLPLGGVSP